MKVSATLKSQSIVEERKNKGLPVYNFGLGANPLPISEVYSNEMKKYLGMKGYVSANGVDKFQNVIKERYSSETYRVKNVLTSNGLKEMLFLVQMAFEGTIIHITPSWISYREQLVLLKKDSDLIEIETCLENNYKIDLVELDKILSWMPKDRKKLLIFNNPNNPTGVVHTPEEVKELAKVLDKYNVVVFSDEIYANLAYLQTVSISTYIPHLTIRGTSVSKDLGCGGYRLGWATFPDELTWLFDICNYMASSIYSCATVPIQYATANMLEDDSLIKKVCDDTKKIFSNIASEICECIENSNCKGKIRYVYPQAAWYLFLNFDKYKGKLAENNINSSISLQMFLLNTYGIVTVAGTHFNVSGLNLRFSLVDIINFSDGGNGDGDICSRMKEGFGLLLDYFSNL